MIRGNHLFNNKFQTLIAGGLQLNIGFRWNINNSIVIDQCRKFYNKLPFEYSTVYVSIES